VDPDGEILRALPVDRVVGCVLHTTARTVAPGVVRHTTGWDLIVGQPGVPDSTRIKPLVDLLGAAGFKPKESPSIHRDVWYKLWGNLTMNPVSALTRATSDQMLGDPLVREFCSAAMREAAEIGARIGCALEQTPEERHAVTLSHGAFKTSMLQDLEAGRALEIAPIVAAVQELGARVAVATPHIDALLGLTRLLARSLGLVAQPDTVRPS
jgi:2-dehydropantoate 2-reductase